MGGVRITSQPVRRDREQAGHQVGCRERERVAMRVEGVGVPQLGGVGDAGSSDPRDVPDAEQAVFGADPSAAAKLKRERIRQSDRGDDGQYGDEGRFTTVRHA